MEGAQVRSLVRELGLACATKDPVCRNEDPARHKEIPHMVTKILRAAVRPGAAK